MSITSSFWARDTRQPVLIVSSNGQ